MGEGLTVLASSRNTVRTMATRDIYETTFDEDVQTDTRSNQCPECDGRVTTNTVETVCEECGLVVDEQRIDHGPEWRGFDEDERERTGAPLAAARHDRGCRRRSGAGPIRTGMNSPERSDAGSPGCGVNRRAGGFSRKLNATSHTGWARFAVWRVPSSSPIRSATRRVSSSGVPRTRICVVADLSKR